MREGQSFLISNVKKLDAMSNIDITSYHSILCWYHIFIMNIFQSFERRSIFPHKLRQESWCKVKCWPYIILLNLVLISHFYHEYISDLDWRLIFSQKLCQESWCKVKYWPYIILFNLVLISYFHHECISDLWEKVNFFSKVTSRIMIKGQILTLEILCWYHTLIINIFQTCERRLIFSHKLRQESWCKVKYWPYIILFNLVLI